jgi:hypothetical protein
MIPHGEVLIREITEGRKEIREEQVYRGRSGGLVG